MERFETKVKKAFAERLRSAREAAGYKTMADFADAMGVEPPTYRYWERGQSLPDLPQLTRICQLLDVEPNDLLPLGKRRRPTHIASDGKSAA